MSTFDVTSFQRACHTACGAAAGPPGTASSGQRHPSDTERETYAMKSVVTLLCVWVDITSYAALVTLDVEIDARDFFVYTYIL